MKKIIVFIVALFTIAASIAQTTEEKKVLARVEALNKAIFADKDSMSLKSLLSPKLTYGHSGGKVEDKKTMIVNAVGSTATYSGFMMDSAAVSLKEKNIAVCRHILKADVLDKGKESKLHIGVLQVWILEKKKWMLLARQAYKF